MGRRVAVIIALVVALVAGCTTDSDTPPPTPSPSPSATTATLTVTGAPAGTVVTATDEQVPQKSWGVAAGPVYQISPGGPLPSSATVTLRLPTAATADTVVLIATRESLTEPWTFLPASLSADRLSASVSVTHFSFFSGWLAPLGELVDTFKEQLAEGFTGGLYQDVAKPKCANEKAAKRDGYAISSSKHDAIYWCFGVDKGARVLKMTNHRRYPMFVAHPGLRVVDEGSWGDFAKLAALSRTFSKSRSVLSPGATIVYGVDLDPGAKARARTEIDGFGQNMVAIQMAAIAVVEIFTRFGGKELTGKAWLKWLEATLTASACADALPNPGKAIVACFTDDALAGLVGFVWAPVAGALLAAAGVVAFIQSGVNAAVDVWTHKDQYTIDIRRAAAPKVAAVLPAYPVTDASGMALESYLHRASITTFTAPIEFGCSRMGVLGADLANGNVDLLVVESLCDGDPITTWVSVRAGRVRSSGWASPDAGQGDVSGLAAFRRPYGQQLSVFDASAGGGGRFYLSVP